MTLYTPGHARHSGRQVGRGVVLHLHALNPATRFMAFGLARYRTGADEADFEAEIEVNLRDGTARALWLEGAVPARAAIGGELQGQVNGVLMRWLDALNAADVKVKPLEGLQ